MTRNVEDFRNIAVCGHGSSGKTTLVDHLLVKTGAVSGQPSVDNGTSVCDFDEEEKHHKHSIEASVVHFDHAGKRFNVIDTPGYPDLIGQTIGALSAVETALITIDAHAGIKVNTRRVWQEAGDAGLGRILCITKLDTENINFPGLIDSIREVFGHQCVLFNVPIGHGHDLKGVVSTLEVPNDTSGALIDPASLNEQALETIVETDEAVMEKYLEGEMPSKADVERLCGEAVKQGTLTPIVCVSTKTGVGIDELLDSLEQASLSANGGAAEGEKGRRRRHAEMRSGGAARGPGVQDADRPVRAAVEFHPRFLGHAQERQHGALRRWRGRASKSVRCFLSKGEKTQPIDQAIAGDIVAVAKTEDLHTGTSLGDVELPAIKFPTPMVGLAVAPKTRGDETKLSGALHKITEEDRTVHLEHDPETKEMVLTGMSELHLQLLRERLKRRDKVEVETHEPKIPYRETIQANADGSYRHKKQSGGSGQFGEVHLRMYPFPEGTTPEEFATKERFPHLKTCTLHAKNNFLFVDTVVGGTIPGNFMPAIEKGFLEKIASGVVAGYPVQNICVEVHFGKDHPVDSNETAFRIAARQAFSNVFREARPSLLEPIVKLAITVPVDKVGDISSDLSGRRGQMVGMDSAGGGMTTVEATCPLAEVMTYARTLSSMTGGQGSYTMEFSRYDVVPPNVQQQIIAKAKVKVEEE